MLVFRHRCPGRFCVLFDWGLVHSTSIIHIPCHDTWPCMVTCAKSHIFQANIDFCCSNVGATHQTGGCHGVNVPCTSGTHIWWCVNWHRCRETAHSAWYAYTGMLVLKHTQGPLKYEASSSHTQGSTLRSSPDPRSSTHPHVSPLARIQTG